MNNNIKIAILTSPNQWFLSHVRRLQAKISGSELLYNHTKIERGFDIVFILSYHKIIPEKYLLKNKHNIVVHGSPLPEGKGWAPVFWQVLENKDEIIFSMFEASSGVDDGDIYMQKTLQLSGYELNTELREKQANLTINMCLEFLDNYENYSTPRVQQGAESFYSKRGIKDSELNIDQTLREQFNLLRIVNNNEYPAFFRMGEEKYILKIERGNN